MENKNKKALKGKIAEQEEKILKFWQDNKIFEKSVENPPAGGAPQGDYVFYDGPPFATGLPHYGHIVGSIMKDVVPRYWTMKGFKVERKWGWDCHGLPIENIVEKEMGSKRKKDIEDMGIEKFNELCRSKVLSYVEDWKVVIGRLGRWADMENSYKTMDLNFMESVWWVFKELYDKGLIYEGYRSMHICPRCETTLSQAEVAEGYKMIKDLSAIAKFKLIPPLPHPLPVSQGDVYILAWTTTPWTLIGNVALAVGKDIEYSKVEFEKNYYILAKNRIEQIFKDKNYKIIESFKGVDWFKGVKYKPIFDYYSKQEDLENKEKGWKIYSADFVTTDEGTGVVHIAPAFGEDDLNLGNKYNLPFIQHVGIDGIIKNEAKDFAGKSISPRAKNKPEEIREIDLEIVRFLGDKIFSKEKYEHSYPHCWRCETPLINYATSSWFVGITKIKKELLKNAKNINWHPAHLKEGRFGNWLEGARDWSISRQRFWASVIPIWKCGGQAEIKNQKSKIKKEEGKSCNNIKVVGSVKELEELSKEKVTDLHKHIVDKITFKCDKCGGEMKRVPDVLDTWFDSGSMPYAQIHYPFENKEKFDKNFPAEFIAEGDEQTRTWFYYLHVIGTAIKGSHTFKNVAANGIVLAEDGKKMSKRLQNYPDPSLVMDKYGADALRYYLLTSPVVQAESLNFSEKGVDEVLKKVLMILSNVLSFYQLFSLSSRGESDSERRGDSEIDSSRRKADSRNDISDNVLDKWILSRLNETIETATKSMDEYNLVKATRPVGDFITDLSTWYIRRSRDRFKGEDEKDKQSALEITRYTLLTLSKIMAPAMPFMAEHIYKEVSGEKESVHLDSWPKAGEIDKGILADMNLTREIIEKALAVRAEAGIKIRQPLQILKVKGTEINGGYIELIKDEVNVKEVEFLGGENIEVEIDTEISDELKQEGILRELVRFVNGIRKDAGLTIQDKINIYWSPICHSRPVAEHGINSGGNLIPCENKLVQETLDKFGDELKKDTLAVEIKNEKVDLPVSQQKVVKIENEEIWLGVKKIQ